MPTPVHLHVYDLSQGLARSLSPVLLGRQLDGVWHTAVVVDGAEYYFGMGISKAAAGRTRFGQPDQVRQGDRGGDRVGGVAWRALARGRGG
jgi:hypothetical protein